MSDCLFCKIASGEIPSRKVYEDENVLAFLDIHPCSKGHTVVISKSHFSDLSEMSAEDWEKMSNGLAMTFAIIRDVLRPDGMNMGLNDRKAAGQAISHVHWHIIPRWNGDGGGSMHSIIRAGAGVDVEDVAKLF